MYSYNGEGFTSYHGYGAVDFYGVEKHFGNMDELRQLVDAAHRLGIKVIQDEVANHTGPDHPWVADPPTPTWFNGTAAKGLNETWQTWTPMDPHATARMSRGCSSRTNISTESRPSFHCRALHESLFRNKFSEWRDSIPAAQPGSTDRGWVVTCQRRL